MSITRIANAGLKQQFMLGALEGAALGGVLGICTGGFGLLAIPFFALLRGVDRVNKRKNIINAALADHPAPQPVISTLAKGMGIGALYGAGIGLIFAGFTLGLSIPICAAVGSLYGAVDAYANKKIGDRSLLAGKGISSYFMGENAMLGMIGGTALGLGIALAPFTGGLSLIATLAVVGGVAAAGALCGAGISLGLSNTGFGKQSSAKPSSTSVMTTVGVTTGALVGAAKGAALGALLSPFTFGASIPVGAIIGACIGACSGGALLGSIERGTRFFGRAGDFIEKYAKDCYSKYVKDCFSPPANVGSRNNDSYRDGTTYQVTNSNSKMPGGTSIHESSKKHADEQEQSSTHDGQHIIPSSESEYVYPRGFARS